VVDLEQGRKIFRPCQHGVGQSRLSGAGWGGGSDALGHIGHNFVEVAFLRLNEKGLAAGDVAHVRRFREVWCSAHVDEGVARPRGGIHHLALRGGRGWRLWLRLGLTADPFGREAR